MKKIYFDSIDSTQVFAKGKAKQGIINEIYIAKEQTGGIGRNGHSWFSNKGGLYFSYITNNFNDVYTLKLAVAINKALTDLYRIKTEIKWPNDILLNGKKIAGIICEKNNNVIIAGIGINTNFDENNLGELCEIATTIQTSTGVNIDNRKLLDEILENINKLTEKDEILKLFRKNMAFLQQKRYISQIQKEAKIIGINGNGHLIVESDGQELIIVGGTI